jgi:hypothetical protein
MNLPRPSKIVCVGRNYLDHAKELGNTVPERPLIFLKPPSSLIEDGETIVLPSQSERIEHEGEIAVVIGKRARNVSAADALDYVAGYAALNDVTARDLQRIDDQWTRAKGFDTFCPLGSTKPADGIDPTRLEVICRVNGEVRQRGLAEQMAFPDSRSDRVHHPGDDAGAGGCDRDRHALGGRATARGRRRRGRDPWCGQAVEPRRVEEQDERAAERGTSRSLDILVTV